MTEVEGLVFKNGPMPKSLEWLWYFVSRQSSQLNKQVRPLFHVRKHGNKTSTSIQSFKERINYENILGLECGSLCSMSV